MEPANAPLLAHPLNGREILNVLPNVQIADSTAEQSGSGLDGTNNGARDGTVIFARSILSK